MIILGSTGSIGINALEVCKISNLEVELLSANTSCQKLKEQILEFKPNFACLMDKDNAFGERFGDTKMFYGEDGLLEAISLSKSPLALNAIVGFAGLLFTDHCIKNNKKVALANKESLVAAGAFIDTSKITPVDSEHFALWYLCGRQNIKKMIITASGGALRDIPKEEIYEAGIEKVLRHPNWSMGRKITVDSATMTNKLFEIIEAYWLFGKDIVYDAVIETSSKVHAMIEFQDGVTTAQMSRADMRLPIFYALNNSVPVDTLQNIDLSGVWSLEFRDIDIDRYPVWRLKNEILSSPTSALAVNAANEVAVEAFLEGKAMFGKISETIFAAFDRYADIKPSSLEEVYRIDKEIRGYAKKFLEA